MAPPAPASAYMHTPPPSGPTGVLLIEPDPTLARGFQELLTTEHCSTLDLRIVSSLREGVQYLQAHQVTVILVNLILPDSRGREAVGLLRQTTSSSALIGFCRPTDTALLLDAVRAGAHEVLFTMPPSATALNLSIQCALVRATRTLRPPSPISIPTSSLSLSKVVHDLNNSLTSIKGFADILLARLSVEDPSRHCAEQIHHGCAKAEALIKQLSGASIPSSVLHHSDSSNATAA